MTIATAIHSPAKPSSPWLIPTALGAISLLLVSRWARVWLENADYTHGWAIPFLTAFLIWERWPDRPPVAPRNAPVSPLWLALAALAVPVFCGLRLMLEPFPEWPVALWTFSLIGYLAIFGLLTLAYGAATARHFLIPILFSATALPWPSMIDLQVIHPLRLFLAAAAAEVVNFMGHPAIAHGTVIQIGRGMVGVDEACSGVRSLQTALMVSLFLGELYRFSWQRRFALLAVGIACALVSNLIRTIFLSLESALHGSAGVEHWHDTAGNIQLVLCLGGLALTAWWWSRRIAPPAQRTAEVACIPATLPLTGYAAIALVTVVVFSETITQIWFERGDKLQHTFQQWAATLPVQRPDYRADAFTPTMQDLLGCTSHEIGQWRATDGANRAGYILDWQKGQNARFTPVLHNPTICLPMSGSELLSDRGIVTLPVGSLSLPFHSYTFSRGGEVYYVYYLAWDLTRSAPLQSSAEVKSRFEWYAQQWQEVTQARRDVRARVITLAIYGESNPAAADAAFKSEIARIIRLQPS